MKLVFSLLPLLLLAQAPSPADPSSERVRFEWPVGTSAVVETEFVNENLLDGTVQQRTELRMTHEMRVHAGQDGRVIENSQHRHLQSRGDVPSALRALTPLLIPRTVVNDKGEFVRTEQAERVQELLTDMYGPLANSAAASSFPPYKEFVQKLTAGDGVSMLGRSEWASTVGKWVGSTLDPEPIEGHGSMSPAPGVLTPSAIYQRMSDRTPCIRAEVVAECATFEIRQTLTPEGLAALMDYANRGVTVAVPGTMTMLETIERARLEIATMLPHEISITRTMRGTMNVNGRAVPLETAERRTMRYKYQSAR
jgi:hypothetical protein